MHGCGNVGLEPSYAFRSAMTAGNILIAASSKEGLSDANGEAANSVKKTVAIYKKLRPYMLGDFYPLFPHSESESQWYGYQFDNPGLNAGCAILFRREKCSDANRSIKLNGVNPNATYVVTNLDTAKTAEVSGRDLLEKGLSVAIQSQPGSALIQYAKQP
jgi:hypothetical protein